MIGTILAALYRSARRDPFYAALNLLGLSIGIAVFILVSLYVRFETSFEAWIPRSETIYLVKRTFTNGDYRYTRPQTTGAMLDHLHEDHPDILGTRVWANDATVHVNDLHGMEQEQLVDANFFAVFDLPLLTGDKASALQSPDNVLISEAMAIKYFGHLSVLGRVLTLTNEEGTRPFTVSGVLVSPPATSGLRFDIVRRLTDQRIASMGRSWQSYHASRPHTYLVLDTKAAADRLNAGFDDFVDVYAKKDVDGPAHAMIQLRAHALRSLHLEGIETSIWALGTVGLLAFLVAMINYVNLATARAGGRARDVAVRKALGATPATLRAQFIGEAMVTMLLAVLLGVALVELLLPWINRYGGLSLALDLSADWRRGMLFVILILVVGLCASIYPAFLLAGFRPAPVLAASRTSAGGIGTVRVRQFLVATQFSVVIALFILLAGFFAQIRHMATADLGFRRDGLLLTEATLDPGLSDDQRRSLWTALRAAPGVVAVTAATHAPGIGDVGSSSSATPDGVTGARERAIGITEIGDDFFSAYGAHLIAGRFLDAVHGGDLQRSDGNDTAVGNTVINEQAVMALGYPSAEAAVGRVFTWNRRQKLQVVGVIGDMRFRSPQRDILPMLYLLTPVPNSPLTAIRFAGVEESHMRTRLAQAWRATAPQIPFKTISAVDSLEKFYRPHRNRANLLNLAGGVAALIGCIGLYGMAAFATSRRTLEIAVRKALGASRTGVARLLVGQFLRPVLAANLIAWPAAYWVLADWLRQFNDRIELMAWPFLGASAASLFIALATVGGLALVSAGIKPANALRA